jgi:aspartate carbamoyltransferase catalytic subunit
MFVDVCVLLLLLLQVDDLRSVASDVDVLYMTRIQKERFSDMDQYKQARGQLRLSGTPNDRRNWLAD